MVLFAVALAASVSAVPAPTAPPAGAPVQKPVSQQSQLPEKPRKISIEDLASPPLLSELALAPDGKRLLARINFHGKTRLGIHTLSEKGGTQAIDIPDKNDLVWYRWAGNNRILISLGHTVYYFGQEAYATSLVCYDFATGKYALVGRKSQGLEGDDLLYVSPDGSYVLLSIQKTIYDYPSVFRVNLTDMSMKEVVGQRSDVWEWYADKDGIVRAGIDFGTSSWTMVYRKSEAEHFKRVGKASYDDEAASLELLNFARGSDEGFVLSNKETGRFALYKYNFVTRTLGEKVFESKTNDLTGFTTSDDGQTLKSVWYTEERDKVEWFDPKLKGWQASLDKAFKRRENWIGSRSADDSAMIVWTGSSDDPGSHYLYIPGERTMALILTANEKLKPTELAPVKYVTYAARDGLQIPAYLTMPVGRVETNLPLVILPHGGPYDVRDKPDFDPEVQLLANRGYVVLQPNFRGSGGYGKAFYEKGEGQWVCLTNKLPQRSPASS